MSFTTPLALLLLLPVLAGAIWAWAGSRHGLTRRRRLAALAIRLLIFIALILAMAGATWDRPQQAQAVAFVGDLSASTLSGQDGLVRFIDKALHQRGHDDLAALVATGKEATVEQPPGALTGLSRFESVIDPDYTNLEGGLGLGAALLPPGYRHRVVLVSDGRENLGDAVSEAKLLRSEGTRVDTVAVQTNPGPEVRVDGVQVPANLHVGERFPLTVAISSTITTTAALQVYMDGQVVKSTSVAIGTGSAALTYQLTATTAGMHTYRVVIQPLQDTLPQNNEGSAFATVTGPPQVLVVEGYLGAGANVLASLRAAHIAATVQAGYAVSPDLAVLGRYAAVVLANVPADELGPEVMASLRSYVGDLGHGLVAVGGTNSFGVGNYGNTPLEEVLPVRMDLPKRKDLPTAAVVLIIEDLESEANVNISKRAGEGVIGLLNPEDQVAVSDADSKLVVPLQYVTDKASIIRAIQNMQPLDPMSYAPYLEQAYQVLKNAKAQTKHIILLGDGDAEDDYQPLLKKIRAAHIQVSTIETNASAAQEFQTMKDIARWGGGKYYPADNVTSIPQVFLKVARTVAHTSIMEGKFYPVQDAASPILAGITAVQDLQGYIVTTPKSLATVVLASPKSDPILAQWQYGLGRAVAWTSDSQGRWTADWLADPATKGIWASMVNWVLPPPQSTALSLSTSLAGGVATVAIDSQDNTPYRSVTTRVVDPLGAASTLTLQPTAPNHYEAQFLAGKEGAYLLDVQAKGKGGQIRTLSGGLVVPYAPDYRDTGTDTSALTAIAAAGGGALLTDPAQAFADNTPPVDAPTPLQWPLLLLALLLLPLDVATRRLVLTREDWAAVLRALRVGRGALPAEVPAMAPLAALRERRAERRAAGAQGDGRGGAVPERAAAMAIPRVTEAPNPALRPTERPAVRAETPAAPGVQPAAPATPSPRPTPPVAADAGSASKLLEAKRRRRSQ